MLIGLSVFLFSSILCLAARNRDFPVAARALQGVGAGCIWPCTLALGANKASRDEHRALVMGLILAGVTSSNVFGPVTSGLVVHLGDWRLVFLANVVFSTVSMGTTLALIPRETDHKTGEHIDLAGMGILSRVVLLLLYGLDVGVDWTWLSVPPLAVGSIVSGTLFNDFGPKRLVIWGHLSATTGAASIFILPMSLGYLQIQPGMALIGLGATRTVWPSGTAADRKAINGGTLTTGTAQAIMGKLDADQADAPNPPLPRHSIWK